MSVVSVNSVMPSWVPRLKAGALRSVMRPVAAAAVDVDALLPVESVAAYLHLPFCGSTCSYCSFNKTRSRGEVEAYIRAMEQEVAYYARQPRLQGVEVSSVYLGGGTPSHLPAEYILRLLDAVARGFRLRRGVQVTLEANPESVEPGKLRHYAAAGINRISVGVQTFNPQRLRLLGRRHRPADIWRALDRVCRAGFEEINIDLMYGLPGQTLPELAGDLRQALAAPISHIALFPMIYRPQTAIARHRGRRPSHRLLWQMYRQAVDQLTQAGFEQYTTEDFTRSGRYCEYQRDVWHPPARGCLGFGAGALSTFGDHNWHNIGDIAAYVAASPPPVGAGGRRNRRQQMVDFLLAGTKCGEIDPAAFARTFDVSRVAMAPVVGPLSLLRAAGVLHADRSGTLRLGRRACFYASLLWSDYILDKLASVATDVVPASVTEEPADVFAAASTHG